MQPSRRSLLKSLCVMAALPWLAPMNSAFATAPMRIGVIGAGSLGGTVGRLWIQAGHEVMFSSRHPEQLEAMTRNLGPRASTGLPMAAAEFGTVLLALTKGKSFWIPPIRGERAAATSTAKRASWALHKPSPNT